MAQLWTTSEVEILKENYPLLGSGRKILELLPGRTSKSINVKASRLGLKVLKVDTWTTTELNILKELYPKYGTDEKLLLLLPNRSKDSIRCQAVRSNIICNKLDGKRKPIEVYLEELSIIGITLLGTYTTSRDKTLHRCNTCNHEWYPTPNNLIQGSGCPNCATKLGFPHTIGHIYLLNICDKFLKVGITSRNINNRIEELAKELDVPVKNIFLIDIKKIIGPNLLKLEKDILTNPTLVRYTHTKKFGGYTELFNISELQKLQSIFNEII